MDFFPRQTVAIYLHQPHPLRRFSYSLAGMAILTGVILRVYRSLVMMQGSTSWVFVGGALLVGIAALLGLATAHIANYPLHQWAWRVPVFVLVEFAAEMVTSGLLIFLKREANGATSAHWDDWVSLASGTLLLRGTILILWGLILAGVVQFVRTRIVAEEPDDPLALG